MSGNEQPQRLTHEQIVARLKSTSVHPMASEVIPPMGLRDKPTFVPGHSGIQAYFWIIGMALSGSTTIAGHVVSDNEVGDIAENAIRIADAVFDKLALKFELLAQPKESQ